MIKKALAGVYVWMTKANVYPQETNTMMLVFTIIVRN